MGKVSIIMGIYNCQDTLGEAIDSILNQTYKDWELIMCDDCSTDKTYEVAKKYKDMHPDKIILLKNTTNLKLAATLNKCLDVAKGKYIARMDSDDICLNNRLEKQVEFLRTNSDFQVVGSSAKIYDGEKVTGIRQCKTIPDKYDVLINAPFIHPSIMMYRAVYNKLKGYTVSKRTLRGQDIDLWIRFFNAGYKGYNLNEPLIIYHESKKDLKKRRFSVSLGCAKTIFYGCRLMKAPLKMYIYSLKPLVSYFIPHRIKRLRKF